VSERIVLYASRRHQYRRLAGWVALLAVGAGLLAAGVARWVGWALAIVGGGAAALTLRALGEETERIVIDDAGIRDSVLPVGTIAWDELRGAEVRQIGSVRVVALDVRDPERFLRRLPATRRFIARKALEAGLPGLYLTLAGTEGNPDRVANAIRRRLSLARGGSSGV
jgi:hypothetical protein